MSEYELRREKNIRERDEVLRQLLSELRDDGFITEKKDGPNDFPDTAVRKSWKLRLSSERRNHSPKVNTILYPTRRSERIQRKVKRVKGFKGFVKPHIGFDHQLMYHDYEFIEETAREGIISFHFKCSTLKCDVSVPCRHDHFVISPDETDDEHTYTESEDDDDDEDFENYKEVHFYDSLEEEACDENESPLQSRKSFSPRQKRAHTASRRSITVAVLSPDEISEEDISNIAQSSSNKTYSSELGTSCHQCRQKTLDTKTICRSGCCIGVRGYFCGPCLQNRYGESAAEALKDPNWTCPPCRGLCNCSICRTRNGQPPTGILVPFIRMEGYKSVMEYLKQEEDNFISDDTNKLLSSSF